MLESTVWKHYNEENSFRELLAGFTQLNLADLINDEKELYGVLKAKLTKKELKLFAMDSAKIDDKVMKETFSYNEEDLQKAKFKLYKKFKQDKIRLSFRA
ncbi:MAG: hypothetical protein JKY28_03800 [Sulfurimonas sp.]|nr:hypothetical protein [Sulfurimonas sp.]PHQ91100.1 MAG: hypothetical protein COB42_03875 [Sulfurimonas sp.]